MPSMLHEALIELFRNRPQLAAEMLTSSLKIKLPEFTEAKDETVDFTEIIPTEYRADLVILLKDGEPVLAIVIEVQLSKDPDKRASWPVYLTTLRARYGCPACLLVVCPDAEVARYCSKPIPIGHKDFVLTPHVLGPSAIPVVKDPEVAKRSPELSVLSVMAHGKEEHGEAIGRAALQGILTLDDGRCSLYTDLVLHGMTDSVRNVLEALMKPGAYEFQTEFVRKHYGAGHLAGKAEGEAKGKADGKASGIITVFEARGLEVSDALRQTILSCRDLDQLDRWLKRAVTIATANELFE